MVLSEHDIATIETTLGTATTIDDSTWSWQFRNETNGRTLDLTLSHVTSPASTDSTMGQGAKMCVASVITHQGYAELHDVTTYVCIEPDEVLFVARHGDHIDSLVVGRTGTCSHYGNINIALLKADITSLDPVLLMAAMQLSLAEGLPQ